MNEYDTLKFRDINFNIDSYVFSSEETLADFEYKYFPFFSRISLKDYYKMI